MKMLAPARRNISLAVLCSALLAFSGVALAQQVQEIDSRDGWQSCAAGSNAVQESISWRLPEVESGE